jgi:hypothetical protein
MKFLKNIATTGLIAATAIGFAVVAQPQQAQAISLTFTPVKTNIDADATPDVLLNSGETLTFEIKLLVDSINPVTSVKYLWGFDGGELGLQPGNGFTPSALFANQTAVGPVPFGPFQFASQYSWNGSLLADATPYTIGTLRFTGLNTVNDGIADFGAALLSVVDSKGAELSPVLFSPKTYSYFEVQPVPTPALIPGIAAMGMGLLRRKKAQEAAA